MTTDELNDSRISSVVNSVQCVNEASVPPFSSHCLHGLEFGEYKECAVVKGTGILKVNVVFSYGK
jgi:hypothetical protein